MNSSGAIRAEHESVEAYLRQTLDPEQCQRVLIVSFSEWGTNTVAVGEIAANLHAMGTSPIVALWGGRTPLPDVGCDTNHRLAKLALSPTRDQRLATALRRCGLPPTSLPGPPIRSWRPRGELPTPSVLYRSGLRELQYRGAPVGRAILQVHPDTNTPVTDDHDWPRDWVTESIRSYAWAFDQTEELIRRMRATAVVVFNGRFLHDSAVAAAAEQADLPVLSFDFGGNDTDFDLTIDATHDWSALQKRMLRMYEEWDPAERDELGSSWFEERRQHSDPRNTLFVESQTVGLGIDKPAGTRLVAYFSSSGDEISELDLDWNDYFNGQPSALMALADACRKLDDTTLLVRTHPHKRHKPTLDVQEWHEAVAAAAPDVHLDEFSEVDSYTLMRQADVIVTYGSTTGVEAGYAERPVVVMGPSAYDELGCARRVITVEELHEALSHPAVGNKAGAVAYGLMMRRRGFICRYVENRGGKHYLAGVELRDSQPVVQKVSHVLAERRKERLTAERAS